MKHTKLKTLLLLTFFSTIAIGAEDRSFTILAPYVGKLSNTYSNPSYRLNLDETGTMTGAFAQWVHPKYFQANAFFYYAPPAEMTDVVGLHTNADYYPLHFGVGKVATGIDIETLKIHTVGGFPGVELFELNNNVFTVMPRLGVSVPILSNEGTMFTLFPYAGVTYEGVSGDVSVDPMGPTTKRVSAISENSTYASLGVNLTLRLFYILEIQGKYLGGLKNEARQDAFSAMINVYLTRSLAVSYRFRHMDLPGRSNRYHLVGLAMLI